MRYYPYGESRTGSVPTDRRFTGQRYENVGGAAGLYDYRARTYDARLGRFLQADTIVPEPGNPQSLNRYAYVYNAPLRYTDPTGRFSKEEIMQYLGADVWAQVLAYFEAGGQLEGWWGWLGVLRQAELGWTVSMWSDFHDILQDPADIAMTFIERGGQLWLSADSEGVHTQIDALGAARLVGCDGVYSVDGHYFGAGEIVLHPTYDAGRVDWAGIGIDALGILADALSLGFAGRLVNAAETSWRLERAGDALGGLTDAVGLGRDLPPWVESGAERTTAATIGLALDMAGILPFFGVIWPDAAGILVGLTEGYTLAP
jgi:RHS repeat-associated protein